MAVATVALPTSAVVLPLREPLISLKNYLVKTMRFEDMNLPIPNLFQPIVLIHLYFPAKMSAISHFDSHDN